MKYILLDFSLKCFILKKINSGKNPIYILTQNWFMQLIIIKK